MALKKIDSFHPMYKYPLSVCILTLNEAHNIDSCIASVAEASEVLIGDTGSTDETVTIARKHTDKIFHLEFQGHAVTKAKLASHATHNWVLSLDADERITPELWDEIKTIVQDSNTVVKGMLLRRRSFFLSKRMRVWDNDYQLRLYRKDVAQWNKEIIHCGVEDSVKA